MSAAFEAGSADATRGLAVAGPTVTRRAGIAAQKSSCATGHLTYPHEYQSSLPVRLGCVNEAVRRFPDEASWLMILVR